MSRFFDDLFPPLNSCGVSSVSGVSKLSKPNEHKGFKPFSNRNTLLRKVFQGVSRQKPYPARDWHFETPETPCFSDMAERYQERAAIIEFDAGLSRDQAEHGAYWDLFSQFVHHKYPDLITEFEALVIHHSE